MFFFYLNITMYKDNAEGKMKAILRILEDKFPLPMPVSEITSGVNISAEKVESFLRFLAKYGFVTYEEERKIATIHADFLSLKE